MARKFSYICLCILIICSVSGVSAFGAEEQWTSEEAVKEFHTILNGETVFGQMLEKLGGWESRVAKEKFDFGDEAYIVWLGKYILSDKAEDSAKQRDEAVQGLVNYVMEKGSLPESATNYAGFLTHTLSQVASEAIENNEYDKAGKLLGVVTDVTKQPDMVYAIMGQQLLESEDAEGHDLLVKLLEKALHSEDMTTKQKHDVLAFIYSDRKEIAARKQMEKELESFVNFESVDLDGNKVSVDDYKGKVLLVDFWASWCVPCMQMMPDIVNAYNKYKDQGFEVLGVSLDREGSKDQVLKAMSDLGMGWKVIYEGKDWQSTPAVINQISSIPAVFLLDHTGKARFKGLHGQELTAAIEELLAEMPEKSGSTGKDETPKG